MVLTFLKDHWFIWITWGTKMPRSSARPRRPRGPRRRSQRRRSPRKVKRPRAEPWWEVYHGISWYSRDSSVLPKFYRRNDLVWFNHGWYWYVFFLCFRHLIHLQSFQTARGVPAVRGGGRVWSFLLVNIGKRVDHLQPYDSYDLRLCHPLPMGRDISWYNMIHYHTSSFSRAVYSTLQRCWVHLGAYILWGGIHSRSPNFIHSLQWRPDLEYLCCLEPPDLSLWIALLYLAFNRFNR